METKNSSEMILQRLEQLNYDHHYLVPPTGHGAGGLALFWKQNVVLDIISADANCIETSIRFEGRKFFSSFSNLLSMEIQTDLSVKKNGPNF